MKYLRKLFLSLSLIYVLASGAFAGETGTPPCTPGELQSPPCAAQSVNDDSTTPGETLAPPASDTAVDVTDAVEGVLWVLSLF